MEFVRTFSSTSRPALRAAARRPGGDTPTPEVGLTSRHRPTLHCPRKLVEPVRSCREGAIPFALACFTVFLLAVVIRALSLASLISTGQKTRRRKPMKELIRVSLLETVWTSEPAAWLAPWQAESASPICAGRRTLWAPDQSGSVELMDSHPLWMAEAPPET